MHTHLGITCIFRAEVFNKDNEIVFDTGEFSNTVLDNGLLKLFDYGLSDMIQFVNVGDSTIDIDTSQTGLQNRLYSTNNVFNSQSNAYYSPYPVYKGYKRVLQFNIGTCTGEFKEVGLSRLNNSDYFNRQKFRNAFGHSILVRVKADEGLRITCDLRIYPDPETKVYSQIYKLNLNGNTSGNITFTNGTVNRTLTFAQLTNPNTAKSELETLLGISTLTNYVLHNNNYYILGHPMNTQSLNLSISGNTMEGGSGPPILSIEQDYYNPIFTTSFDFNDITGEQIAPKSIESYWVTYISSMNNLTMKLAAISGNQFNEWGYIYNGELTTLPFKNLHPRVVKSDGSFINPTFNQIIKSPILGDYSWIKKCYYSPGKFGTGNQNINGLSLYYNSDANIPNLTMNKFVDPIIVPDNEEIEFNVLFSWGRYELKGLNITIVPQAAILEGAMWRIVGTDEWQYSGDTLYNLTPNTYQIEFKSITSYKDKEPISIVVTDKLVKKEIIFELK